MERKAPFGSLEHGMLDLTRRVLCIDANLRDQQGTTL